MACSMTYLRKMELSMDDLKSYLMNCDLEDLTEETREKYEDIAHMRQYTEKYWRDRIAAENQS